MELENRVWWPLPSVSPQFQYVINGSFHEHGDTHSVIPFVKVRPVSKSGVHILMCLFDRRSGSIEVSEGGWFYLGTDVPHFVELTWFFRTTCANILKVKVIPQNRLTKHFFKNRWYGLVDGSQSLKVISTLMNVGRRIHERWLGYKWTVKVVCITTETSLFRYQMYSLRVWRTSRRYW